MNLKNKLFGLFGRLAWSILIGKAKSKVKSWLPKKKEPEPEPVQQGFPKRMGSARPSEPKKGNGNAKSKK